MDIPRREGWTGGVWGDAPHARAMRAIHPDTREVGAKLGGAWAVGDRVNAVKNKNALRRQKPGVIRAVRVFEHELHFHAHTPDMHKADSGDATHLYEIQFDNGDVEQDVLNTDVSPCPVAEVKKAAPNEKAPAAAAPAAKAARVEEEAPVSVACCGVCA